MPARRAVSLARRTRQAPRGQAFHPAPLQETFPVRTGTWHTLPLLALLTAFAVAGCSNRPRLAEVKGRVMLNGKPLANIMVEFIPDGPTGPRSLGTTDESGHYTLLCDDKRPGALVGPNRVLLHDAAVFGDKFLGRKMEFVEAKPSRIPRQYGDVTRTPLKKEVMPEPNTIDLDVTGH
jgi:hypothetical protein